MLFDHVEHVRRKIFEKVSMGGRFGKYGDAKRKAQINEKGAGSKTYVQ